MFSKSKLSTPRPSLRAIDWRCVSPSSTSRTEKSTEMDKSLRETFEKRQLGQSSGESEPEGWCTWAGASEMTGFVGFWLRRKTFFHHICMFCMFCVSSACSVPSLLRTPPDSPGHLDQHRQDVLILQIHRIWKRRLLSDHRGCRQGCEGVETFVFRQSGGHIFETKHFEILRILWCVKFLKSELWDFFGYFGFAYFCLLFFLNQAVGIAQKVALLPWPPQTLQMVNLQGKAKYPVNQINVLKSHGQSSHESMLIPNGYAMQIMRASQDADAVERGNWRKISENYWKDPEHTEDGACRVAVSDQEMPAWVSPAKIANASLQSLEFHDASVIRHSLHKFNLSCAKLLLHKLCCLLICFVLRKNWHRQIR